MNLFRSDLSRPHLGDSFVQCSFGVLVRPYCRRTRQESLPVPGTVLPPQDFYTYITYELGTMKPIGMLLRKSLNVRLSFEDRN